MPTAIDATRNGAGLQTYYDAVFLRDGIKLYFGTDGDESLSYDATSDVIAATSLNLIDNGLLTFGTNKDFSISTDGTSLNVLTISDVNPATAGALFYVVMSDNGSGSGAFRTLAVSSG